MSDAKTTPKIEKSEAEWRKELTPMQYAVLREKATERPFSGEYEHEHRPGTYVCAGCGEVLFDSDAKFDSGCGWPSFTQPKVESHVDEAHHEGQAGVRAVVGRVIDRIGDRHGHQEVRILGVGLSGRQRADQSDPMYARHESRRTYEGQDLRDEKVPDRRICEIMFHGRIVVPRASATPSRMTSLWRRSP